MKLRASIVALAVGISTVTAPAAVAPHAIAAEQTMADTYELSFSEPPRPFAPDNALTSVSLGYLGVPEGTKISVLDPDFFDTGRMVNGILVEPKTGGLWVQIFPKNRVYGSEVPVKTKYLVEYPDGYQEVSEKTVTIYPAQMNQYRPGLDSDRVELEKQEFLSFTPPPANTKVELLDAPEGWNVTASEEGLTVTSSAEGTAKVAVRFIFEDGSTRIHSFSIRSEQPVKPEPEAPAPAPEPEDPAPDLEPGTGDVEQPAPSGSSKTVKTVGIVGGVIALILALIGGAVAFAPQLGIKLPF